MTDNTRTAPAAASMRAIGQDVLGGPEVLREIEVPRPLPGPGRILVAVRAAGVNPTDWKHRAMRLFLGEPPYVLGWDVSGVVEAVGLGVTLFVPGDEVFGMLPYPSGAGAYAEYVTGPARAFARKPPSLDHIHAAALPLAGLTAWQALVDTAHLSSGQRVLIHAAAGGVGHLAVQLAKERGAQVIGTASRSKHDFVRSLGADEVIDYRTTDFAAVVKDVDIVLDTMAGDTRDRSLATLRPGGILVTLLPYGLRELAEAAARQGVRTASMLVEHDQAGMAAIARLAAAGALSPTVARTFPLAEAAQAHRAGETGRTAGKLVLTVP